MDGHIKRLYGVYRAVVDDNNDPQHLRRLKVKVQSTSFDRDATTNWIWPMISTKRPPAIGSGVYVLYLGGDPDYPVWVGEFSTPEDIQGVFAYGSWFSTSDQVADAINTEKLMTVNNTDFSEGISVVDSSKFTVEETGTYNLQFSAQLHRRPGGGGGSADTTYIWLKKNGVVVPNSSTSLNISSGNYAVAAWNFFVELKYDEYVQLAWSTSNTNLVIEANGAVGPSPAIPSLIVTMNQIA
jgi:hypothetical protein